jgi:putative ABC transport system permease protein
MTSLLADLRYAARALRRSRTTTAIAVLALALGIGVNASSFITIDAMVLHPMAYPRLERIMTLWGTLPKGRTQRTLLSAGDFVDLERASRSFTAIGAYREWQASLTGQSAPERVQASLVTPDFFTVLGMRPELGRTFAGDEQSAGPKRVVVVSDGFWKTHLAASPSAIGKAISLNGANYSVIGVMPDSFDLPLTNEIWAPLVLDPAQSRDREHHDLFALGLLKREISAEQARADVAAIAGRLEREYPHTNRERSLIIDPLRNMSDRVTGHFVLTLFGAAGFVLLLACANVGNLQLARAANREREIAVRAALGASRFQIAREMLAETVLISLASTVVGLLLASWYIAYSKTSIPPIAFQNVPGLRSMHVNLAVVLFTIGMSLVAAVLCTLPAIAQVVRRRMRADLTSVLRAHSTAAASEPARNTLRAGLIVFEIALALVLLVGAGLMVKTFKRLLELNQGFDPKNLLTLQVALPPDHYREAAQKRSFYDHALEKLSTLRQAKAAALFSYLGPADGLLIEGQPEPRAGEPRPGVRAIGPRYFNAMRIPLIEGRAVSDNDGPDAPHVVVISEDVAHHYWPDSDPVGHRIRLNASSGWLTVVGVSGRVIENWFMNEAAPLAYVPYAQFPSSQAMLLVRTAGEPMQVAGPALRELHRVDSDVPVFEVKSMEQQMYEERGGVHAAASTMTSYAVIAFVLAITGIYAVISYFVAARTHDIGVHMALGASRADVLKMTLKRSLLFTALGLACGIPVAALLSRLMSHALFDIVQVDFSTFAVFGALMMAAGLLAAYLPGRRATRIDPMAALRND